MAGTLYDKPAWPWQSVTLPVTGPAGKGKRFTASVMVLAVPSPQMVCPATEMVPETAPRPKLTVMLFVPAPAVTVHPEGRFQV